MGGGAALDSRFSAPRARDDEIEKSASSPKSQNATWTDFPKTDRASEQAALGYQAPREPLTAPFLPPSTRSLFWWFRCSCSSTIVKRRGDGMERPFSADQGRRESCNTMRVWLASKALATDWAGTCKRTSQQT